MTSHRFDTALGDVLQAVVRPKRNTTWGVREANKTGSGNRRSADMKRAARIVQRTPEVMVRISGGARGSGHVREHLNYITRNGKLEAENEQGEWVMGRDAVRDLAGAWRHGDGGVWRRNSKDTVNMVLSMPPGTDRDKLQAAVRSFAARTFSAEREYVFVRHDDTKHPHCHLTLRAVGYDGKRLNPRKADLQVWRESFAACLREQGVAAEATPRRARGVVRKAKRQAIVHAEQRSQSTVAKAKVDQAARRVAGKELTERPWEQAIARRQRRVRSGWLEAAAALEAAGVSEAKLLAAKVREFVREMSAVQTEQQALEARMREHLARQRDQALDRPAPER